MTGIVGTVGSKSGILTEQTYPGVSGTATAGHIISVKYHSDNTMYSIDGVGTTDCTNYNMSFTPSSATNRLLITMSLYLRVNDENTPANHECQGSAWIRDVTNSANLQPVGAILQWESGASAGQKVQAFQTGVFCHVPTLSSGSITYSVRLAGGIQTSTYADQVAAYRSDSMGLFTGSIVELQV